MLSEHRFNAVPPRELLVPKKQPDGSYQIPARQVQALREFVDGYHVNALQTPHPSSAVKDPVAQRETLGAWLAAFDHAAKELDRPQVLFYTYLKDEPNTLDDYRYVQKWGRAVRDAQSVVKVLVVDPPWTEAPYYVGNGQRQQGKKGIIFNGEGSLVYPARAVGYDGVVPTIRLKALRDSIQDYDYLTLLQRLGQGTEAQKIVRSLTESFFQWNKDAKAYEQARLKLAGMLTAAQNR